MKNNIYVTQDGKLKILKSNQNRQDCINVAYMSTKNKEIYNEFNITYNELSYIFGQGIINCITNRIDSEYNFDIVTSKEKCNDIIYLLKKYAYSPFINYKRQYLVRSYTINISMEENFLCIKIKFKYGFVNNVSDNFHYTSANNFNSEIKISINESLSLADFAFDSKVKIHSS